MRSWSRSAERHNRVQYRMSQDAAFASFWRGDIIVINQYYRCEALLATKNVMFGPSIGCWRWRWRWRWSEWGWMKMWVLTLPCSHSQVNPVPYLIFTSSYLAIDARRNKASKARWARRPQILKSPAAPGSVELGRPRLLILYLRCFFSETRFVFGISCMGA